jgi:putative ABC transport system permease protein
VVLTAAGLLIKSYLRVLAVEPGYRPEKLLTFRVSADRTKYKTNSLQLKALFNEVLTRVKAIPGVTSVAGAPVGMPMTGAMCKQLLIIEGRPPAPVKQRPQVQCNLVSLDYFGVLGIQLRAGRSFTEQDDEKAPLVVIINEALARLYFSGEDPIGKRIELEGAGRWGTIVGIVGDVKRFGPEAEVLPEIYRLYSQSKSYWPPFIFLAVRTAGNPLDYVAAIRDQIGELRATEPIREMTTMEQRLAEPVAPRRFQIVLFGIFALVALLLAAVGIYGVISYSVSRRTHEIGIRMALGARSRNVLLMIISQGVRLVLVGVIIGLATAFALTRVLKSLLFDLSATDPATFAVIASLLLGVALLACYLPARRATRVDPMTALRHE